MTTSMNGHPAIWKRTLVDAMLGNEEPDVVCAPDCAPFFEQAVTVIDTARDDFVPVR